MSSNNIFTRKMMGIDKNVLFTMLIAFLLCSGFLGYTITKTNKEIPCKPYDILIFGQRNAANKIYYNDNPIAFSVTANVGDKVAWDFSDNSPNTEGAATRHVFAEPKYYLVTATINSTCQSSIKVNIRKKENIAFDSSGEVVNPITGESEAFVNEPVTFTTQLSSSLYEWSIDKPGYAIKKSKSAIFTFKTVGTYTVKLMINNDRKKEYEYSINIKPINKLVPDDEPVEMPAFPQESNKPPVQNSPDIVEAPKKDGKEIPSSPATSEVSNKIQAGNFAIQNKLQDYVCGSIILQSLDPYFCDLKNTPITAIKTVERILRNNGHEKIQTSIGNLFTDLNCAKTGIEITSIEVNRDNNHCVAVTSLIINFKETKKSKACPNK